MLDILIFSILGLGLMGMGRRFLGFIVPSTPLLSFLETAVMSFGLGAGFLALMILALGLLGLLYQGVLITLLALLSLFFWKNIGGACKNALTFCKNILRNKFSPFENFLIFLIFFVCFFTLVGSLSPILGMDAASYHMRDPKVFIQSHKIIPIVFTRESLWPFLVQMLFTLGLCLKGVALAKLFHFSFYIASILTLYVICRRSWPRFNSMLAATIYALTPAIFTNATYAYTDMAVVFYTLLAFYGFFLWRATNCTLWLLFSGIACGFLLGIKVTSGIVPMILFALCLIRFFFNSRGFKKNLGSSLIFLFSVLAVCGVWYVRSWIVLGNPIYPFAAHFFPGHAYPIWEPPSGIGTGWIQFLTLLWPLTMTPWLFGGESIGPLFLLLLPMLVFVSSWGRFERYVVILALGLYASWFFVYQYTRFLFPAVAFFSILVAFAYTEFCSKEVLLRRFSSVLLIFVFLYGAILSVYHNGNKFPVVFGLQSERDYLLKHERSYAVADYVNKNLPKNAKLLLIAEPRSYYFDRETAMMDLIQLDRVMLGAAKNMDGFEAYARKAGFGEYMVFMRDYSKNGIADTPITPQNIFMDYDKALLNEVEFAYRDERYVYEIWKINDKMGTAK